MNFNTEQILSIAKTVMPGKVKQLETAINKAKNVLDNSQGKTPAEIFESTGVSKGFIDKIRKNTSNPIATMFMKAMGLDVNQANNILDTISGTTGIESPKRFEVQTNETDDLSKLKTALKNIKK